GHQVGRLAARGQRPEPVRRGRQPRPPQRQRVFTWLKYRKFVVIGRVGRGGGRARGEVPGDDGPGGQLAGEEGPQGRGVGGGVGGLPVDGGGRDPQLVADAGGLGRRPPADADEVGPGGEGPDGDAAGQRQRVALQVGNRVASRVGDRPESSF